MAKKVLKQLLLVTLVLCILMLGTTTVLAEEQTDLKADIIFNAPPATIELIGKTIEASHIVVTIKNGAILDESMELWYFFGARDHDTSIIVQDVPVPKGVFFANAIITPKIQDRDEDLNQIVDYLIQLAQTGTTVYVLASEDSTDSDEYVPVLLRDAITLLDQLSDDSESVITKDENEENIYIVSKPSEEISEEKAGEETIGYIHTYVVGNNLRELFNYAATLFTEEILNYK